METNDEGRAEQSFKSFGKKIDEFIEELKQMKSRAKVEYADQIEELKRNKETLKKEFEDFRKDDKWDVVEDKLENAAKEVRDAFKTAFKKREK